MPNHKWCGRLDLIILEKNTDLNFSGSKEHFSKAAVNQVKDTLQELSSEQKEVRLNNAVSELVMLNFFFIKIR